MSPSTPDILYPCTPLVMNTLGFFGHQLADDLTAYNGKDAPSSPPWWDRSEYLTTSNNFALVRCTQSPKELGCKGRDGNSKQQHWLGLVSLQRKYSLDQIIRRAQESSLGFFGGCLVLMELRLIVAIVVLIVRWCLLTGRYGNYYTLTGCSIVYLLKIQHLKIKGDCTTNKHIGIGNNQLQFSP